MSVLGVLPLVDLAIHADTGWERESTYAFAAEWGPWLADHGLRVITVSSKISGVNLKSQKGVFIPAYTLSTNGVGAPGRGILYRQCTQRWKIAPIRRYLREHYKGEQIELQLGITLDEIHRVTTSNVSYIENQYPFVTMTPPMRRGGCIQWLRDQGLQVPVSSSCVFCPSHSRAVWREIRNNPADWSRAVEIDHWVRHKRPTYLCYLTPERRDIQSCDFRSQEDLGQLRLHDM